MNRLAEASTSDRARVRYDPLPFAPGPLPPLARPGEPSRRYQDLAVGFGDHDAFLVAAHAVRTTTPPP